MTEPRRGVGRILLAVAVSLTAVRLLHLGAGTAVLVAALAARATSSGRLRRGLTVALPFALFAAVYGWLGLLGPHVVARGVHVVGPYQLDKELFGLGEGSWRLSLNELFARYHGRVLDFVTGVAYFSYLYVVAGFALFLALVDRSAEGARRLHHFGWSFLALNLAGFITYVLFPAAPPWYVASHGLGPVDPAAMASPAGLLRFDHMLGISYFARFYAQSQDVFGSMPSLHCAYPMLTWLFVRELGRPGLARAALAFQLLTCFAAVYLQHHYVIDALAGSAYAALIYGIDRLLRRPAGELRVTASV